MKIKTAKEYYLWNAQGMLTVPDCDSLAEYDKEKWKAEFIDYKKAL